MRHKDGYNYDFEELKRFAKAKGCHDFDYDRNGLDVRKHVNRLRSDEYESEYTEKEAHNLGLTTMKAYTSLTLYRKNGKSIHIDIICEMSLADYYDEEEVFCNIGMLPLGWKY